MDAGLMNRQRGWARNWRVPVATLFGVALSLSPSIVLWKGGTVIALAVSQSVSLLIAGMAGALYARHYSRRVGSRLRDAQWTVTRALAAAGRVEQLEEQFARLERVDRASEMLKNALTRERSHLGMMASGMVELRSQLHTEQSNLGSVADGLHEVRVQLSAAERGIGLLDDRIRAEQGNLGLVAGALDDLRRTVSGVERVHAKQAGFADLLIELADRIDVLDVGAGDRPAGGALSGAANGGESLD